MDTASLLGRWESFYVIVGSSAGALTGLQFVVIALIAENQAARSMREIRAFGTPTVVHFCAVLFVSAIVSAPWGALHGAVVALSLCGAAGVVYGITVIRHARGQAGYRPDAEDWWWYVVLPLTAYFVLLAAGLLLSTHTISCLFVIAATCLVLLFVGIHNAWDTVTYIAIGRAAKNNVSTSEKPSQTGS
jgi:hypothetical protein